MAPKLFRNIYTPTTAKLPSLTLISLLLQSLPSLLPQTVDKFASPIAAQCVFSTVAKFASSNVINFAALTVAKFSSPTVAKYVSSTAAGHLLNFRSQTEYRSTLNINKKMCKIFQLFYKHNAISKLFEWSPHFFF